MKVFPLFLSTTSDWVYYLPIYRTTNESLQHAQKRIYEMTRNTDPNQEQATSAPSTRAPNQFPSATPSSSASNHAVPARNAAANTPPTAPTSTCSTAPARRAVSCRRRQQQERTRKKASGVPSSASRAMPSSASCTSPASSTSKTSSGIRAIWRLLRLWGAVIRRGWEL